MAKVLVVVDVQNDFVSGSLGSVDAQNKMGAVNEKCKRAQKAGYQIYFTRDIHYEDYLNTQEGKALPVKHCIEGTWGSEIAVGSIKYDYLTSVFEKNTFGCQQLADNLEVKYLAREIESITLIGFCTDICVVSNALMLKAVCPEIPVIVDASCCAGTSYEMHEKALDVMQACQVIIENR